MDRDEYKNLCEKKTRTEKVYDGVLLKVFKDEVILPNGKTAPRELIKHPGAVAIVPLSDEMEVYVERQYRYPLDKVITEIPAGKLNSENEDKLQAAKRELKEETGLEARNWTNLGALIPTCAYSDESITCFLATELSQGEQNLDDDEFLNVKKVPLKELIDQVMSGEIEDAKTQSALLKTWYRLQNESPDQKN